MYRRYICLLNVSTCDRYLTLLRIFICHKMFDCLLMIGKYLRYLTLPKLSIWQKFMFVHMLPTLNWQEYLFAKNVC